MANISLLVSRNGNSRQLKINQDDDSASDVSVGPGDKVTWSLAPSSGLSQIIAIAKTVQGDPSFDQNAVTLINSICQNVDGSFSGTVISPSDPSSSPFPPNGSFESYKICFTVPGDPQYYWDDPKLQMNA